MSFDPFYRCTEWVERCSNKILESLSPEQLRDKRVCSLHFSLNDFQSFGHQGNRKIKPNTIPSDRPVVNIPTITPAITSSPELPATLTNTSSSQQNPSCSDDHVHVHGDLNSAPVSPIVNGNSTPQVTNLHKKVTPKEAAQARLINKLRQKIIQQQQRMRRMAAAAKRDASLVAFAKSANFLNYSQQAFIQMQLNLAKKKPWSEDGKLYALSLYYVSPKAYYYLRNKKQYALPCITLVRQWINELNLTPGISTEVFKRLEIKAATMDSDERQCVLMWDEMSLKRFLEYNPQADLVEGFHDLGELG